MSPQPVTRTMECQDTPPLVERLWEAVFEHCSVGIAMADAAGRCVATNGAFRRLVGHDEEDLSVACKFLANSVGESGLNSKVEKQHSRKDGSAIWLNATVCRIPETETTFQFLIAFVEDITDHKLADESERQFRTTLDNSPSSGAPCWLTPEMQVLLTNEGLKSGWALPLIRDGSVLGVLSLTCLRENAFTHQHVGLLGQVADQVAIAVEDVLRYCQITESRECLVEEKLYLDAQIRRERGFGELVGKSLGLKRVLKQVDTVAATDATVLILGETGTGKDLIARAIHSLSPRRDHAFVRADCSSIPGGLLESELFGHEKGAFTGAIARSIGRVELANRGTLFLDEVGDIPLELQSKLLRVLQEQELERLGSNRTVRVDFRLVAATNRDLGEMVERGQFRRDLFYRLNVFPLEVPPIRERPEDVPLLVWHFVKKYARMMNKRIEKIRPDDMKTLAQYHWPGNVRELQNVVERSVILSSGEVLNCSLVTELQRAGREPVHEPRTLAESERAQILGALRATDWVVGGSDGAAERLGVKRTTLLDKMRRHGISRPVS